MPDQFVRYAVAVGVAVIGLAVVDSINPRLGSYYVAIILLGVALTHRDAVTRFAAFLQQQTKGM